MARQKVPALDHVDEPSVWLMKELHAVTIAPHVGFALTLEAPDLQMAAIVNSSDALGIEPGAIPYAMALLETQPLKVLTVLGTESRNRVRSDVKAETGRIAGPEIYQPGVSIPWPQTKVLDRPKIVKDDAYVSGEGIVVPVFFFVPRAQDHRQAAGSHEPAADDLARLGKQTSALTTLPVPQEKVSFK